MENMERGPTSCYVFGHIVRRTEITFPLYRPIGPPAPNNSTMNHHWPQITPTTGMTMKEIIDRLPPEYKQVVGAVALPRDDGWHSQNASGRSGQTMWAWSDGTVKQGEGAHTYTLRTSSDDAKECSEGSSMTPRDPTTICSLRTEHCGAFAIALIAHIICITDMRSQYPQGI